MEGVKKYFYFYCIQTTKNGEKLIMDGTITTEDPLKAPEDFKKLSAQLKLNYGVDKLVITSLSLLYEE
jgi:hypothetical protein